MNTKKLIQIKKLSEIKVNEYFYLESIDDNDFVNDIYKMKGGDVNSPFPKWINIIGVNIKNSGVFHQYSINTSFYVYRISRKENPEYYL